MSRTTQQRLFYTDEAIVTIDAGGENVPQAVPFPAQFVGIPHVSVVVAAGDTGTFAVSGVTESQFTLTVTNSIRVSQRIYVTWFACEKV